MMSSIKRLTITRLRYQLTTTMLVLSLVTINFQHTVFASESPHQSFTGEQVFRGVFLGEAPVSHLLPEIWAGDEVVEQLSSKERVLAWEALKEELVTQIKTDNPSFFDWLEIEMQSGEHLRVQNAMQESSVKMQAAMITLGVMNPDGSLSTDYQGSMGCSAAVVCVVAVAVAAWKWVAVVDVAAVAVVAAIAVAIWRWKPTRSFSSSYSEDPNDSLLFREEIVDAIANRLDTTP